MPFAEQLVIAPTVSPAERESILGRIAAEGAEDPRVIAMGDWLYQLLLQKDHGRAPTPARAVQWLMDTGHLLVEYKPDPPGTEVFQSIPFTLFNQQSSAVSPITGRRKGTADCEDQANLAASFALVWRRRGYTPSLSLRARWWDQPGAVQNHVAGEACDPSFAPAGGVLCLPAETTVEGARLGETPQDAVRRVGPNFHHRVFGPPRGVTPHAARN